jgi:hypothetical protein
VAFSEYKCLGQRLQLAFTKQLHATECLLPVHSIFYSHRHTDTVSHTKPNGLSNTDCLTHSNRVQDVFTDIQSNRYNEPDIQSDTYRFADTDKFSDAEQNTVSNRIEKPHGYTKPDTEFYTDGHPFRHSFCNTKQDNHANAHGHTDRDTLCDADRHAEQYGNCHSYQISNNLPDTKSNRNTQSHRILLGYEIWHT